MNHEYHASEAQVENNEPDSALVAALRDWQPPPPWKLATPAVDEVIGGAEVQDWIRRDAFCLGACYESPIARMMGLGLVCRLHDAKDLSVNGRVVDWARSLTDHDLDTMSSIAFCYVDMLYTWLDSVNRDFVEHGDGPELRESAAILLNARDDLESLLFVAEASRKGRESVHVLRRAVAAFDDEVICHFTAFPPVEELHDDPRLQAVWVCEPDAWWGGFGAP